MKKKSLVTMIVAVTLVAVVGVGATLAYFTDKEDATNVITMGHVDIELTEPHFDKEKDENGNDVPGFDGEEDNVISNIVPGQEVPKDPTITLTENSARAYIRVKLNCKFTHSDGTEDKYWRYSMENLIPELKGNSSWYYNSYENCYYYQEPLNPGDSVTMFNKVVIPADWGNKYADGKLDIAVNAEAIQADGFTPETDGDKIIGWKVENSDGDMEDVTPEKYEAAVATD